MRGGPSATHGFRRYVDNYSRVYTVGTVADPLGVLREMLACLRRARPGRDRRQPRVRPLPVRDQPAPLAGPRLGRPRLPVQGHGEAAGWRAHGLLATFIGKPWNDDEGSGFHLHISLCDDGGANSWNGDRRKGLSPLAHHFAAGLILHGPALDGLLQPHHQRLPAHPRGGAGADTRQLGHDNRLTMVRVPRERGAAPPGWSCGWATGRPTCTWPPPLRSSPAWTGSSASWSRRPPSRA